MEFALEQLYQWMGQWFYPFCRVGAFFMALPIVGAGMVPIRIRLGLSVFTTLVIMMSLPRVPQVDPFSGMSFLIIVQQILLGLGLGFFVQLLFQAFVVGGQAVAMQTGLGFSVLMDPVNGFSVTSISQLYLMSTNLLFFTMNGHLAVLELLTTSFFHIPVSTSSFDLAKLYYFVEQGSWMFQSGLLIALPAVTALLVVNFIFGVMSRVAPQMNIIAIGFPFTMVAGLIIIWLTLGAVLPQFTALNEQMFIMMRNFIVN